MRRHLRQADIHHNLLSWSAPGLEQLVLSRAIWGLVSRPLLAKSDHRCSSRGGRITSGRVLRSCGTQAARSTNAPSANNANDVIVAIEGILSIIDTSDKRVSEVLSLNYRNDIDRSGEHQRPIYGLHRGQHFPMLE